MLLRNISRSPNVTKSNTVKMYWKFDTNMKVLRLKVVTHTKHTYIYVVAHLSSKKSIYIYIILSISVFLFFFVYMFKIVIFHIVYVYLSIFIFSFENLLRSVTFGS